MRSLQPKGGLPTAGHPSTQSSIAKPTKSRHGCRRCKQRRRKCGEEKPQCKRCVEDGVSCPGYTKEFRWSSKYEVLQIPGAPTIGDRAGQRMPPSLSPIVPDISQTGLDQRGEDITQFLTPGQDNNCQEGPDSIPPLPNDRCSYIPGQPLIQIQDNRFSPTQEVELPLPSPVCSLEQVAFASNDGIASPEHPFGVHAEDNLPYQVPLSIPDDMQPEEQDYDDDIEEVVGRTETALIPARRRHRHGSSNSTHAPEDLLRWYYRMTPTQYSDSDLVEHYFSKVCRLYALFDSTKNPFRALVGHNWDSSGSINLAIQSMSCAHLANSDSAMVHVGVTKQRQARISIQNDLQLWRAGNITADRVLLAVLLLGPTVSWHNASDIGLEYLNIARELINAKLSQPKSFINPNNRALEQFFLHAMIYYEMMISFVDSRDDSAPTASVSLEANLEHLNLNAIGGSDSPGGIVKPHPWTGVAPHVQMLFAEVGRIMRRRVRNVHAPLATQDEINWAMAIEKALICAEIPGCDDVIDSEDQNTPEDHFIQLAEAYRCAGLLQVYHVFPTVLLSRLMATNDDENAVSANARDEYRINLALHTLRLVEALPISSGTSCLHPILVLTAGSELRYHIDTLTPEFSDLIADQRIAAGREFAERRLSELARRLPQQPFLRMISIMKETWLQMDLFNFEVHWMQVM